MAKISIPETVFPGFLMIAEMQSSGIQSLLEVLKNINAGEELDIIEQRLNEHFGSQSRILLQTIISFSGLLEKDEATSEDVSKNLTESFSDSESKITKKQKEKLELNLNAILSNLSFLRKNIKSRRSILDNESLLRSSKLITDLRILFQDDLSDQNRDALILHKLHVEYQQNFNDKEIYFTLDLKDLNRLKAEIEKAIEKDQIIREDYKNNLNILY